MNIVVAIIGLNMLQNASKCTISKENWVWGWGIPLPRKIFGMFSFEMVHFDAFWNTF